MRGQSSEVIDHNTVFSIHADHTFLQVGIITPKLKREVRDKRGQPNLHQKTFRYIWDLRCSQVLRAQKI